jgi:hypothetical protein
MTHLPPWWMRMSRRSSLISTHSVAREDLRHIFSQQQTQRNTRIDSGYTSTSIQQFCTESGLSFWHRSFTLNSNKSPIWCNKFPVYDPDICLQLKKFRAFSRPSSGAQWLQWQPLLLPSYRGDSRAVFVVGPVGYHHDTKVKPEATTAVIELLMMGGKTPETCWAVNKCQDNKLKNFCIRLVIYLNCTMMHGLTNLKFYI